ncbi:Collagen alpha-6(VI) chain [Porphyridium purpureum]|uniref:Collagen alpha-6(VI) chain n=1 Tax=Porphyridium purpureum TaxID=35688 RepID=A0A5J4ZAK9_PORPP|nr:Collagen alpha-6(VI) chain [Porphyridium purpureum]|eukprot:POR2324..scf295_1
MVRESQGNSENLAAVVVPSYMQVSPFTALMNLNAAGMPAGVLFSAACPSGSLTNSRDRETGDMDRMDISDSLAAAPKLDGLPSEVLSQCLKGLSAQDMATLERVDKHLRDAVQHDSLRWRDVVLRQFSYNEPCDVLDAAAHYAGGWRSLYVAKVTDAKTKAPWYSPTDFEVRAICDVITQQNLKAPHHHLGKSVDYGLSRSPTNIMDDVYAGANAVKHDMAVLFLLDGSSSVTEEDFKTMKAFCLKLIESVRLSHPKSVVGLIQFNQFPRVEMGFRPIGDAHVTQTVQALDQMMGSTDISAPVRQGHEMFEEAWATDNVMVLLTDGQTQAEELRQTERYGEQGAISHGIRMFTMGVGRDVDESGLMRIAAAARKSMPRESVGGSYFALRKYAKRMLA